MGLLSRAENNALSDEMGKALLERIKRLPRKKNTPYIALSLLKAYGSFQAGICLSLEDDLYSSYASVGLGVEKTIIPRDKIWSAANAGKKYFILDSSGSMEIKTFQKKYVYWVFPLDTGEPWGAVMLLGISDSSESRAVEADSAFYPGSVSAILEGITDKFLLQTGRETSEAVPSMVSEDDAEEVIEELSEESDTLEAKIAQYQRDNGYCNCIVLEIPDPAGGPEGNSADKEKFCKRVSDITSMTGTVFPLPSGRPLILLPLEKDRDLIAHRLSKSLNTRPLMSFEADSPENILGQINSLL